MMGKKKVFVTGASSELMQKFLSFVDTETHEIIGLTRNLQNKSNSNTCWIEGDIQNIVPFENILKECDIIVHGAAITHSFDEQPYYDINYKATVQLVNFAKQNHVKKFIFISSRTAGYESGAYGKSKIMADEYIVKTLDNWIIFRPSEIYGGTKNEAIIKTINDAIHKRIQFCPVNISSKLFPIHINDAARIMADCAFGKEIKNEIITVNGPEGFSFQELIRLTNTVCHKKTLILPIPKFAMYFLKNLIQLFHIDIGLAPDQIPRLYSQKQQQKLPYEMMKMREFVETVVSRKHL